jgi:hypothetical protein
VVRFLFGIFGVIPVEKKLMRFRIALVVDSSRYMRKAATSLQEFTAGATALMQVDEMAGVLMSAPPVESARVGRDLLETEGAESQHWGRSTAQFATIKSMNMPSPSK